MKKMPGMALVFGIIVLVSICSPEAITFKWTTPIGDPTQYDMRSHVDSATLRSNWAGSSVVPGLPVPLVAGAKDSVSFVVNSSVPLYFGIKSADLAGNWSTGFNIVSVAPVAEGTRLSDSKRIRMYDTTKVRVKHKRREMTIQFGDSTEAGHLMSGKQFHPSFSMQGWRGEARMRIFLASRYDSLKMATREELTYKSRHRMRLATAKVTHDIRIEDWGTIWDMILPSKPDRNVFRYRIRSRGLRFIFQDTLTDEEKITARRPDSVIGSYAIYLTGKANNHFTYRAGDRTDTLSSEFYGTGKFGHLYRPKAWDSAGDTVWCRIRIDTNLAVPGRALLRMTIPQAFLNRAVYPVTVDPDVGVTTLGGTSDAINSNRAHGQSRTEFTYQAGSGEEVTSMTGWLSVTTGTETMDMAVYSTTANGARWELVTRLTNAEQISISNTAPGQELSTSSINVAMVSGTRYSCAWGGWSTLSSIIETYYDAESTGRDRQTSGGSTLGASWNHQTFVDTRKSFYFTYGTAAVGDDQSTRRRKVLLGGR